MKKRLCVLLCLLTPLLLTTACAIRGGSPKESTPSAPSSAIPEINVWVTGIGAIIRMDMESYVAGVVAGEMPSDWPMEALKAQAILARTYVLKFITEKESRYPGADISTDIAEAQAYNADAVDSRILTAVHQTRGIILLADDGSLPYTWFHAHSGGMTALATESLDWRGEEPAHTRVTAGLEPDDAAWSAEFTQEEFLAACRDAGYAVSSCQQVNVGETGPSGRAVTLNVDGTEVNAARLRISLGSSRMRSTLLTALTSADGVIRMAGRGYGHGVGLSQWGARALAEDGKSAEEIALHYYSGLQTALAW
ncbi:MAG: SpoIID/LytB domain-containing protein [Clostridia bacterium]|nr:SpoIID/LytB domain-containing protein [Clostridia bacterium]